VSMSKLKIGECNGASGINGVSGINDKQLKRVRGKELGRLWINWEVLFGESEACWWYSTVWLFTCW